MKIFRTSDDKKVLCNVGEMEIWLPMRYFDEEDGIQIAELDGDFVETMGIFVVRTREKDTDPWQDWNFIYGTFMKLLNNQSRKETARLGVSPEDSYMVLEYQNGDVVFPTNNVVQNSVAFTDTINAIIQGRLPSGIPYSSYLGVAKSTASAHGADLGIPHVLFEAVLATLCRAKSLDKPFRMQYDGTDETSFVLVGVKKLAKLVSSYGITFEDLGNSIPHALDRAQSGKTEPEIPIERSL
jgi:hypothetical protein